MTPPKLITLLPSTTLNIACTCICSLWMEWISDNLLLLMFLITYQNLLHVITVVYVCVYRWALNNTRYSSRSTFMRPLEFSHNWSTMQIYKVIDLQVSFYVVFIAHNKTVTVWFHMTVLYATGLVLFCATASVFTTGLDSRKYSLQWLQREFVN